MKERRLLAYNKEITLCTGSPDVMEYTVRVEQVEPARVWVMLPVTLAPGARVRVRAGVKDQNPARSGRFEAEVAIVAADAQVPGRIALEIPERWSRVQERDFARMNVSVPVKWRAIGKDGAPHSPWRFGHTVNLSGGGLGLRSPVGILAGSGRVELQISLNDEVVEAHAQVIRDMAGKNGQDLEKEDESVVALSFTRILEADRDRIVRFVFELQADLRRKGLA